MYVNGNRQLKRHMDQEVTKAKHDRQVTFRKQHMDIQVFHSSEKQGEAEAKGK